MVDVNRRLRLTYLVPPSPVFAGVERVVHEIASSLAREHGEEFDVHVIYGTRYDDPELKSAPYTRHELDVERLREMAVRLRATLAHSPPDVLICAQVEPSVVAWLASRGLGIEHFVPHLHGNPIIEQDRGSRSTKALFAVFKQLVARRSSAILVVAPSMSAYTADRLASRTPVYWSMNPVRALPTPERIPAQDGTFRFINVARHSYQKGLDLLLDAWAVAAPRMPSARLTLVGSGPDEDRLRRQAASLGITQSVHFAGFHADPGALMSAADCFVLASRWEGFPLALLEALSVGLPILSVDCDFGPRDLITDPRLGRLVTQGDALALAEGLIQTVSAGVDRAFDSVRREAASQYRPDEAATQHLSVLRQIIAATPSGSSSPLRHPS